MASSNRADVVLLQADLVLEPVADAAMSHLAGAARTAPFDNFHLDLGLFLRPGVDGPLKLEAVVVVHDSKGDEVANVVGRHVRP